MRSSLWDSTYDLIVQAITMVYYYEPFKSYMKSKPLLYTCVFFFKFYKTLGNPTLTLSVSYKYFCFNPLIYVNPFFQASAVEGKVNELLENYKGVLDDVEQQLTEADEILKNGMHQQQITDELLADADAAESTAEDAVKLGNKTLQEAQQTLETLQGEG